MEHNLYAPLMNKVVTEATRPAYLKWLERLGIKHIFLASDQDEFYSRGDTRKTILDNFSQNIAFFRERGFTVGIWIRGYGFGVPFAEDQMKIASNYVSLRSVIGNVSGDGICPENEYFADDYINYARDIASTQPDMIMIDDDLCVSVRPGLGCFCAKHREMLNELVGEELPVEKLPHLLFTGGKNKYRSAWLSMVGNSHRRFAQGVRAAIDSVDPTIRAGFCAGFTSWDIEGVDAIELTKILAGNTTPFLRFTGAPYWEARGIDRFKGQPIAAIIEDSRAQEKWCRDSGIEVFCESDTYPRPRPWVSSSMMECFSLPLWANGGMGELGYFFDYVSTPDYETGYYKHRIANKPIYDFVKKHMADKPSIGVRVYNEMHKVENVAFPKEFAGENFVMSTYFNRGSEFLAMQCIPTTYDDGAECAIAFGEEARYVGKMPSKMIIDIRAAQILTERGIDVGLVSAEAAPAGIEFFPDEQLNLSLYCGNFPFNSAFYRTVLKDGTRVESEFGYGTERFPASYRYTANGTEYLVFAFDAWTINHFSAALLSYKRQRQLIDFIGNISVLPNNPGIYQLAKRDDKETALLFVNICEDTILDGVIELDRTYSEMELCGAEGVLEGDKIILTAPVPAFGMFAVLLK